MNLLVLTHPRSGHHAFIDWLCSWSGLHMTHVNDPLIDGRKLITTGPYRGHTYWGSKRHELNANTTLGPNMVINFERPDCREVFFEWESVIFIREFNNFLSSVTKLAIELNDPTLPDLSVPAWDWCAEQVLEGRRHVLFDKWVTDASYRESVAADFGIKTDGKPWQRVSPFGGTRSRPGSSFDALYLDGQASMMQVTKRDLSDEEVFRNYATPERLEKNGIIHSFYGTNRPKRRDRQGRNHRPVLRYRLSSRASK